MIQENFNLSEAQIQHFEVFGFLVRRNLFSAEEVSRMNEEFDRRLATVLEETDIEGKRFLTWSNLTPDTPFIASLLDDPRIYLHSEQLIGEDSVFINSGSNSFPTGTGWHPDRTDRNMCALRNVMYLQPTTADRGALRVIPGSHKNPLHEELRRIGLWVSKGKGSPYLKKSGLNGEDIPCYIIESEPGDLITFNELTWHAAFGGYKDRRSCNFDFFRNPKSTDEVASMRLEAKKGKQYDPSWLENPDNIPRRERWLNWLTEWGFFEDKNKESILD